MSICEWVYHVLGEGIKFVLLGHWIFGYEFNQKKTRYLILLYLLGIPFTEYLGISQMTLLYEHLLGVFLLLCLFQGRVLEKVKSFFVSWFLIALVDTIGFILFLLLTTVEVQEGNILLQIGIGSIGIVFWGIVVWKGKRIQKQIQSFWVEISWKSYVVLLTILFLLSLGLGGMQAYLYNTMTNSLQEVIFVLAVLVAIIFLALCAGFVYNRQSKKRLEEVNRLNAKYLELQQKYYEESLEKYEDMRGFRHDLNKHIYMMAALSRENRIEELKQYIYSIQENYSKMKSVHTGNFMADCIIGQAVAAMQKLGELQFQLDGHFPEELNMEDIDFCVLLSNVLENAREALELVKGTRLFEIEVKSYRQWLYLNIRNSAVPETIDFEHTSKQDQKVHGYGVQNMKRVVEKYHGSIQWEKKNQIVEVAIQLEVCKNENVSV